MSINPSPPTIRLMISHKCISNFIRQGLTAPTEACKMQFQWMTALWYGWLENWLAKYRMALIIDLEVKHLHSPQESGRTLQESPRQTQLILDPFPHTANDHWLPIPASSGSLDFWEKHNMIHSHTSASPPQSVLPHSCTCQLHQTRMWLPGSVREAVFFFHMLAMDERLSYLFIGFCPSLWLYPIFDHPLSQFFFWPQPEKDI